MNNKNKDRYDSIMESTLEETVDQILDNTSDIMSNGAVPDSKNKFDLDEILNEIDASDYKEEYNNSNLNSHTHISLQNEEAEAETAEEAENAENQNIDVSQFIASNVSDYLDGESNENQTESIKEIFNSVSREIKLEQTDNSLKQTFEEKSKTDGSDTQEKIIQMKTPKFKVLRESVGAITDRLHAFADSMYDDAVSESQIAEDSKLPANDVEEYQRPDKNNEDFYRQKKKTKKMRRSKKRLHQANDIPIKALSERFKLGLSDMHKRWLAGIAIFIVMAAIVWVYTLFGIPSAGFSSALLTWLLLLGVACELDVLWVGIEDLIKGKCGIHTLAVFSTLFTVLDGVVRSFGWRNGEIPYSAATMLLLLVLQYGMYERKKALYISCNTISNKSEPHRITLDSDNWAGESAYYDTNGDLEYFGSQIQSLDFSQYVYRIFVPIIAAIGVMCSLWIVIANKNASLLTWSLSAVFTAITPLAGTMAYGHPFLQVASRLDKSNAALAGWDGLDSMSKNDTNVIITDEEIFPEGTIKIVKADFNDSYDRAFVLSCCTSILREVNTSLYHTFDEKLRFSQGVYSKVDNLQSHKTGGYSADIQGEQVLIGNRQFAESIHLDVSIADGYKYPVFCIISGEIAGIFSIEYALHPSLKESMKALINNDVYPLLVTRDFNVTPEMLKSKPFSLDTDDMVYPDLERRIELSDTNRKHSDVLGAVTTRNYMQSMADVIIGSQRLHFTTILNTIFVVIASVVGLILTTYLACSMSYNSLRVFTMLSFLIIWVLPTLLISMMSDKF